jgi:molecular chaperone GrpE
VSKEDKRATDSAGTAPDVAEKPDALPEEEETAPEAGQTAAGSQLPPEDTVQAEVTEEVPAPEQTRIDQIDQDEALAAARAEAQKNLEGWQRTLAEFQNYKRRVEREQSDLRARITLETLTRMLALIDDFERALDNMPEDLENHPWTSGIRMIQDKFNKLLEEYDVEVLDPLGEMFDPELHQAVGKDNSDEYESGQVIDTLQKGYISGDVLLRPAVVRVAN